VIKKERGLGRGLDALFFNSDQDKVNQESNQIDINLIIPNSKQPRKNFDDASLTELANSIKEHGILQPIIVRPHRDGFEIVAGERRWRAAKLLQLEMIPAIVKELTDEEMAEISLIENLQREDLGIIEEALAYQNLLDRFSYTQDQLAERIGKSRVYISNTLRLLNFPAEIIAYLDKNLITAGHARALLALKSSQEQIAMADKIIAAKASVRQAEELVRKAAHKVKPVSQADAPETIEYREKMEDYFGSKIQLLKGKKGGKIEIFFHSDDELERIIQLMGIN
jgi:ParB family chromosome partitioning protein